MRHMKHIHALPKHFRLGLVHGGFVPHHKKHHRLHHVGSGFEKRTEQEFASMNLEDGQAGHGVKRRHLKPLTFRR